MRKKTGITILLFLLISIVLEFAVFNFQNLCSFSYEEKTDFTVSKERSGDDTFFEIKNLNVIVNNMYLNLYDKSGEQTDFRIRLYVADEGNAISYKLPALNVYGNDESSKYIKMNLSGKAQKIRITFSNLDQEEIDNIEIEQIKINVREPLFIQWERITAIFLALSLIYFLRPTSFIYKEIYDLKKGVHQLICVLWMAVQIGMVLAISLNDLNYINPPWSFHYQYPSLAHSMAEGHFYLDEEPSDELKNMANPYDTKLRKSLDIDFCWDHAYYEGKYYVYFGVVPVLLLYLPFYLITGMDFTTIVGIIICEIVLIYGIWALLHTLIKRFFQNIPLGHVLLLELLMFLGCGGIIIAKNPTFYNLPIIMAVCFTIWGLYFWISSLEKESKINWKKVFAGSVCMALVAGCRPQMLLASFLFLPIFGKRLIEMLKREESRKMLILSLLPYAIVAGFLMYYNYARFGSVIDFGANYNLTTNDMTKRDFHFDRWPFGIFSFLFQPPAFEAQFPYLKSVNLKTLYQGITIHETMYGGIFMLNPFLLACALIGSVKQQLKEKKLFGIVCFSALSGFIITLADIQMAGILIRYFSDFGLFFCLAAVIIILQLKENEKTMILDKGLFLITIITLALACMWIWR